MTAFVIFAAFSGSCIAVLALLVRYSCSNDPRYGEADQRLDRTEAIRRSHAAKHTSAVILEFKK